MDFYKLILFLFASIALVLGIKAASLESSNSMRNKNITVSQNETVTTDLQDQLIQKQLYEQRKRIFRLGVEFRMPYKNETVDPNEYLHLFNNIDTENSRLEKLKINFNESMIGFSETLTSYRRTIDLAEQSAAQDLSLNETTNVTVLPELADQSLKPVMLANSTISDMKEMGIILTRVHTHLNQCDNELNTDLSNVTLAKDLFSGANEMFSDTVVEFYQNFYSNITRNENEETKNYVMEMINGLIVSLRNTLDLCKRIYQSDRLIKIPQYFNGTYGRFLIFDAVKRNFDYEEAEIIEYDFNDEDKVVDFETNSIDAKE